MCNASSCFSLFENFATLRIATVRIICQSQFWRERTEKKKKKRSENVCARENDSLNSIHIYLGRGKSSVDRCQTRSNSKQQNEKKAKQTQRKKERETGEHKRKKTINNVLVFCICCTILCVVFFARSVRSLWQIVR